MINKASNYLTELLIESGHIMPAQKDIYIFCFSYAFDQICYTISVFIISLILRMPLVGIIMIMTSTLLRICGGGIHAKSSLSCSILTYILDLFILLSSGFYQGIQPAILVAAFLIASLIIWSCVPVDTANKRLRIEQKLRLKKYCHICQVFILLVFLLFFIFNKCLYYGTISVCVVINAISVSLGKLENISYRNKQLLNRGEDYDA